MKISVLGAGAIGSMLGGLIKHHAAEIELLLIGRGPHGEAMRDCRAVRLDGPWGSYSVPVAVSSDMADIDRSDFVLLTVKSQATEEALATAAPYLGEAVVISIQNGINDALAAQYVDRSRLVMGVTATNMAVLEPGTVSLQLGGKTVVGPEPGGANRAAAHRAVELLAKTGLPIEEHPNTLGVRYNKLAMNALGYASCLSQSNYISEALCYRPWRKHVGLPILRECMAVFDTAGLALAKIPGRPDLHQLQRFLRRLEAPLLGTVLRLAAQRIYNRKPIVFSLYQDLLRRRTTEVDYINGEIVRLAAAHGVVAPLNAKVVEMVRQLESRADGTFFQRDEVIEQFRQMPAARLAHA